MGLLSFLAFGISVIAAVIAIDMYKLLRTGEFGGSWRILTIASVIFTLIQALRLAELTEWGGVEMHQLAEIADLIFVMALAYAFYLQRRVFRMDAPAATDIAHDFEVEEEDAVPLVEVVESDEALAAADAETVEVKDPVSRDAEWARLSGRHAADETRTAMPRRTSE